MHREPDTSYPDIARTAAEWVARRDRGLSPAETRAFAAWRTADPRHELELERIAGTWRELDSAGAAPELEAMANTFMDRARARRRRRRILRAASLTFAAAAAVAVGLFTWQRFSPVETADAPQRVTENYRVIVSTVRRETLPDGTVAELNGASRIEVNYSADARRVRLVEGEAHFIVEKMPEPPFYVTAGPVTVRAVGTAFNVRLASEAIEVLVTEGTVKLESAESRPAAHAITDASTEGDRTPALTVGQRAVISRGRLAMPQPEIAIGDVDKAEIEATLGWQSTRLVFNNTPLDEVVAGFNRYNAQQLALGDPKLRSRTLTGVFRADNLDGFLRLLKASVDVREERRTPTETVLLPVR